MFGEQIMIKKSGKFQAGGFFQLVDAPYVVYTAKNEIDNKLWGANMFEASWQLHIYRGLSNGLELSGGGFVINEATPFTLDRSSYTWGKKQIYKVMRCLGDEEFYWVIWHLAIAKDNPTGQ